MTKKTKKTKKTRRKVWVAFCNDGEFFSFTSKRLAKVLKLGKGENIVRMVEARTGDVLLSREQADLICRRLNDLYAVTVEDKHEIRALLRSRR